MIFLASAGSHLFAFAAGLAVASVGAAFFLTHKAAIIADLKAKLGQK